MNDNLNPLAAAHQLLFCLGHNGRADPELTDTPSEVIDNLIGAAGMLGAIKGVANATTITDALLSMVPFSSVTDLASVSGALWVASDIAGAVGIVAE